MTIELPENISKQFVEYCKINGIENFNAEAISIFSIGFNVKKYGTSPLKKNIEIPTTIENKIIENTVENKAEVQEVKPTKRVRIIKK